MSTAARAAEARGAAPRVIGVSFLVHMIAAGMTTYSFGCFLKPVADEFGASRTAVASGQMIFMLAATVLLPVVGPVIDARPVRGLMACGAAVLGTALVAISQSSQLWQAGLLVGGVALGTSLCGSLSAQALVVRALPAARERALGLASVGTSAGGFVLPLLAAPLIEASGWRSALLVLATGSALLAGAGAWLGTPVEMDRPVVRDPARTGGGARWAEVLGARNFWPITLSMTLVYGTNTALIAHLPALASDTGIPAAQHALLVPALAFSSLVGKLLFSALAHRFDPRASIWLASAVQVPAFLLLLIAPTFEVLLLMAVGNGLGTGGLLPAWSALIARCFGAARFAAVLGLSRLCAAPLMATGGVLAALSKDLTGSYELAFQGFLAAACAVALLPFRMRIPAPP